MSDAALRVPTFVRCCRCANGFEHEQKSGPGSIIGDQQDTARRQAEGQALVAGWTKTYLEAVPTGSDRYVFTCPSCAPVRPGGALPASRAGGR